MVDRATFSGQMPPGRKLAENLGASIDLPSLEKQSQGQQPQGSPGQWLMQASP